MFLCEKREGDNGARRGLVNKCVNVFTVKYAFFPDLEKNGKSICDCQCNIVAVDTNQCKRNTEMCKITLGSL